MHIGATENFLVKTTIRSDIWLEHMEWIFMREMLLKESDFIVKKENKFHQPLLIRRHKK